MLDTGCKFVRQLAIMTCSIVISILVFSFFGAVMGLMLHIVIFIGIILYSRRNQLKAVKSLLLLALLSKGRGGFTDKSKFVPVNFDPVSVEACCCARI